MYPLKTYRNVFLVFCVLLSVPVAAQPSTQVTVINEDTDPVPVDIIDGSAAVIQYHFVGFTKSTTDGSPHVDVNGTVVSGIAAMNRFCQEEVDPNARFATTADITRTPTPDKPITGEGWVLPSDVRVVFRPNVAPIQPDQSWQAFVPGYPLLAQVHSPRHAASHLTCNLFDTLSLDFAYRGVRYHAFGDQIWRTWPCTLKLPIACAAPKQVAVSP